MVILLGCAEAGDRQPRMGVHGTCPSMASTPAVTPPMLAGCRPGAEEAIPPAWPAGWTAVSAAGRPVVSLARGELGQARRREEFTAAHPGSEIVPVMGAWQGWVPSDRGGTVMIRMTLQRLLDDLEKLFPPAGSG